jgi:meiotically up-regulated gene 157 (Mug157) protein
MVDNNGNGEPKAYTGLVGTHHRPSDDLSVFGKQGFVYHVFYLKDVSQQRS